MTEAENNQSTADDNPKTQLQNIMTKYFEKCIPLSSSTKEMFFLSPTYCVIGFDIKHGNFFEPNSALRFSLVRDATVLAFNEKVINSFQTIFQHSFSELEELKVKMGAHNKYLGIRAFYSKERNTIYVWNMFSSKWETQNALINRQYFSNCEIIPTEPEPAQTQEEPKQKEKIKYYENLEDLDLDKSELTKLANAKFRDGSTHYFCKKLDSVVSYNFVRDYWYIPGKKEQEQILNTESKESTETTN